MTLPMTSGSDTLRAGYRLTPAQKKILDKGTDICEKEGRPFCNADFKDYSYGTVRNIFMALRRKGLMSLAYRDKHAFYWVSKVPVPHTGWARTMTPDPTGVDTTPASRDLYFLLQNLRLGERCIHDIHLSFTVDGLYNKLKGSPSVRRIVPVCGDLELESIPIGQNRYAKISVHSSRTGKNTVTVILASTMDPFPIDDVGIFEFHTALGYVHGSLSTSLKAEAFIPPLSRWIITRWDLGRDSQVSVSSDRFRITVSEAQKTINAYVKEMGGGKHVLRFERIERPRIPISDLIYDRIERG